MMSPEDSWVSKWQRVSKCSYPGLCSAGNVPEGLQGCHKSAACAVPWWERCMGKLSLEAGKMAQQYQDNLSLILGTHMEGES